MDRGGLALRLWPLSSKTDPFSTGTHGLAPACAWWTCIFAGAHGLAPAGVRRHLRACRPFGSTSWALLRLSHRDVSKGALRFSGRRINANGGCELARVLSLRCRPSGFVECDLIGNGCGELGSVIFGRFSITAGTRSMRMGSVTNEKVELAGSKRLCNPPCFLNQMPFVSRIGPLGRTCIRWSSQSQSFSFGRSH